MSLRIVILGGVAGGMSAAARARRMNERASITVPEKGGFISDCGLPYYLAGRIASEDKRQRDGPLLGGGHDGLAETTRWRAARTSPL